jgi:hypothetical protein
MADETEGIILGGDLANMVGNIPASAKASQPQQTATTITNIDAAKVEADAKAKIEADKAKAEADAKAGQQESQLTDEQIQAKLDDLAKKDEKGLTLEEKQFIEKHTGESVNADEISLAKTAIETKYGFKLEGQFENSPEGLVSLTEAATKQRSEQLLINHFENVPYMKDFYDHVVVQKRSIDTFLEKNVQPEFKSIKVEEVSDNNDKTKNDSIVDNQKRILTMDLASKGVSKEDAENLIALYEDKGNLFQKAQEAHKSLNVRHQANIDARLAEEKARIDADQAEAKKVMDAVISMVDTNNIGGTSIPVADVKAFKDAITKPVDDDGNTLLDYKRAKLTLEQRVLLDYLVFKDLKEIGLSKAQVSNKKFSFKKAAETNQDRAGGRLSGAGDNSFEKKSIHPKFDMTQIQVEQ